MTPQLLKYNKKPHSLSKSSKNKSKESAKILKLSTKWIIKTWQDNPKKQKKIHTKKIGILHLIEKNDYLYLHSIY